MAHRYTCGTCHVSSPSGSRSAVLAARQHHRHTVHAGLIPHGERLHYARRDDRFRWHRFLRAVAVFLSLPIVDYLWRHL